MATNRVYAATSLNGGAEGALDTILGTGLVQGDMAFVIDNTSMYIFGLNASSGAAESSPDIIKPDTNASNKRWILQSLIVNDVTVRDDVILITDDLNVGGELAVTSGITSIGALDDNYGRLTLYSSGGVNTNGGVIYMETAPNYDDYITYYNIIVTTDDLKIGPQGNNGALTFVANGSDANPGGSWLFNAAVDVDDALSATTVDADTDFTVGTSVLETAALALGDAGQHTWDALPASDNTASGDISSEDVDDNDFGIGAILVLSSDGSWDEANAGAAATVGMLGMALEAGDLAQKLVLHNGWFNMDAHGFTIGAQIFLSTTDATMTNTAPSGDGEFVQVLGYATSVDVIRFNPSPDYMEITA